MRQTFSFKEWAQIAGVSVLMLITMILVMNGVQSLVIDTSRAILHK